MQKVIGLEVGKVIDPELIPLGNGTLARVRFGGCAHWTWGVSDGAVAVQFGLDHRSDFNGSGSAQVRVLYAVSDFRLGRVRSHPRELQLQQLAGSLAAHRKSFQVRRWSG